MAGLEQFSNFGKAVSVTALERLGLLLSKIFIIVGVFFVILYFLVGRKDKAPKEKPKVEKTSSYGY